VAARSDAATDRVTLSSAPPMATITIAGWARIEAASAGSFNPIARFHVNSGDTSSWIVGFKGANGRTPSVYSPSNATGISAAEQALSTYVYVAATLSGTAAQLLYGNTPGSLTKVTGTVAAGGTPDRITFFGRSAADGSEWLNGILAHWRIWTAVLSDSEIAAESQSADPVRTSGLWSDWDFAAAALTDGSGNGRNLTAGSTALTAATDPALSTTITGTGVLTAPASVAAGTGTAVVAGSGASSAPTSAAAGIGAVVVTASGAAAAPAAVASGAGTAVVAGTGAAAAPPAAANGTGTVVITASGSLTAPSAVASGTGGLTPAIEGTGALVAPATVALGAGIVIITGTGACVAPSSIAAGYESAVADARDPQLTIHPNLATASIRANQAILTMGDT
jgi:hypothetical protein